ncbi:MAG: entericidin A/B family lipoprotein [Alphaproteobacteria bacterium]
MSDVKKILLVSTVALLTLGNLSACNTIAGAGEDIEAGGDAIEDAAEDSKNY